MSRRKQERVTCPMDGFPGPWIDGTGTYRFRGITGPCHEGHSKCVRQLKRQQAAERNALTPENRRREWRVTQSKRQRRTKSPEPQTAPESTEAA